VIAAAFALRDKTLAIFFHPTTKTIPEESLQGWLLGVFWLGGAVGP
jgi:hypothetical protein